MKHVTREARQKTQAHARTAETHTYTHAHAWLELHVVRIGMTPKVK